MKRAALFALLLASSLTFAQVPAEPAHKVGQDAKGRVQFDPTRDAAKDIKAGLVKAAKEKKHVILDVGGEWCPWCHKLDNFFIENKDASEFMKKNYVVVKVNFSEENTNESVLSKYPKITGYPHLFVLDASGQVLHSQDTGLLETGDHHDHDKVMTFLKLWAPKPR